MGKSKTGQLTSIWRRGLILLASLALAVGLAPLGAQQAVADDYVPALFPANTDPIDISGWTIKCDSDWGCTEADLTDHIGANVKFKNGNDEVVLTYGTDFTIAFKQGDAGATPQEPGSYKMTATGIGDYTGTTAAADIKIVPYFTVKKQYGTDVATTVKTYNTKAQFAALAGASHETVSALFFKGDVWNVSTAKTYVSLDEVIAAAGLMDEWTDDAQVLYGKNKRDQTFGKLHFSKAELASMKFFPSAVGNTHGLEKPAIAAPFVFALEECSGATNKDANTDAEAVQAANLAAANSITAPRVIMGVSQEAYTAQDAEDSRIAGNRLWSNVTEVTIQIPKVDISKYWTKYDTNWGYTGEDLTDHIGQAFTIAAKKNGTALKYGTDFTVSFTQNGAAATPKETGAYTMTVKGIGAYEGEQTVENVKIVPYFTVYRQKGTAAPVLARQYDSYADFAALNTVGDDRDQITGLYFKSDVWQVSTTKNYVTLDEVIADAGLTEIWTDDATVGYGGDSKQGKTPAKFTKAELDNLYYYPEAAGASTSKTGAVKAPFAFALKEASGKTSGTKNAATLVDEIKAAANGNTAPRSVLGVSEADYLAAPTATDVGATAAGKRLWSNLTTIVITEPATDASTATVTLSGDSFVYTGQAIEPGVTVKFGDVDLKEGTDFTVAFTDNTNVGTAKATITFTGEFKGSIEKTFAITKANNPLTASAKKATQALTYKTTAQPLAASALYNVSGAQGAVTYAKKSGDAGITVAADGKLSVKKGLKAGSYKVVIIVKADGNANYNAGTKEVSFTVKVNKAANTLKVSPVKKTQTATYGTTTTIKAVKAFKVTKNVSKGKVSYKLSSVSKKAKGKITVSSAGKVTVKSTLNAGTYTVKVKATSKATTNYKSATANVSFKVKVK